MTKEEYQKLILNMVNFYTIFNVEFVDLIPYISNSEVSPLLSKILNMIHMEGSTTSSFLSKRLNVNISNMSRSINTLNSLGYITKKQDSKDKRIIYLSLSQKSLELIYKTTSASEEIFSKRFEVLSSEELEKLSHSFSTIQNLFMKMRDLNINTEDDK